jgi:hypothetical protein
MVKRVLALATQESDNPDLRDRGKLHLLLQSLHFVLREVDMRCVLAGTMQYHAMLDECLHASNAESFLVHNTFRIRVLEAPLDQP